MDFIVLMFIISNNVISSPIARNYFFLFSIPKDEKTLNLSTDI